MANTELITQLYKALWENQNLVEPPLELRLTAEQLAQNPDENLMMEDLVAISMLMEE